ncbi:hypothetical protein MIZ03_0896 [Rhodoferax lithotrophicus]|uniref:Uncharacterized protein n=1 Tax=Rhodoferax lithotrophicus TaxID=2798804 RepID=A0ABN6D585_9BURK|nr:hypothetical protein MIZ03_0896 [Rhodoferax sp. MIZ03]
MAAIKVMYQRKKTAEIRTLPRNPTEYRTGVYPRIFSAV